MEIIICDDIKAIVDCMELRVTDYISSHPDSIFRGAEIYKFTDPQSVLNHVAEQDVFRLYMLDIDLKSDIDGIELAHNIMMRYPINTYVIYATANNFINKAVEMGTRPLGYISKDFYFDGNLTTTLSAAESLLKLQRTTTIGGQTLRLDDILYIEAIKGSNYIKIVCYSGTVKVRGSIADALLALDHSFVRCDKSLIVNKFNTRVIDKTSMAFDNGTKLDLNPQIVRRYRKLCYNH